MTPERRVELEDMIRKMERASAMFYCMATQIGHHAFIEFTGLMNEYINICRGTLDAGTDFTETTAHGSGTGLKIEKFQRAYLAEKLTCIFETSFPDLMKGTKRE